ncbi:MAG: hypothetical protein MUD08_08395 [Cytophagales bacterium]|jgi:hypothetical protein|nr:hypothetical protein [Cytophagales bacterium]
MKNQNIGMSGKGLRSAVRNSISAVVFVFAFALVQTAFANNDAPKTTAPNLGLQASVHPTADPFRVYVSAVPVENKSLRVSLMNDRNDVFYYNRYWRLDKYRRSFNLAELADGTYTFLIESGGQRFKHTFTISTATVREVAVH